MLYEVVQKKDGFVCLLGTLERCLRYRKMTCPKNLYIRNYYTKETINI